MKPRYKQDKVEKLKDKLAEMVDRLIAEDCFHGNGLTFEYELEPVKLSDGYMWCFAAVSDEKKMADAYLVANNKTGTFKVANNHDFFTKNFDEAVKKLESVLKGERYSKSQIDMISSAIEGKIDLLRDKTNYIDVRGPAGGSLPIFGEKGLYWDYAFEVPDKPNSTSGIYISLDNRNGTFQLTNGKKTKSVNKVLKSIEEILLDERGRKKTEEKTNNACGNNGNKVEINGAGNGANGKGNGQKLCDLYNIVRDGRADNSQYREFVNESSMITDDGKFDKAYFVRLFIEVGIFYSAAVFEKRNNGTTSFFVADSDSYGKYVLESESYLGKKEQSLKELVKNHFDTNGRTVCVEFDEHPGELIQYSELQKFFEENKSGLDEKISE